MKTENITNEITTGDIVRSFDFRYANTNGVVGGVDIEGDRANYIIGKVEGFEMVTNCQRYSIRVVADIMNGKVHDGRVGSVVVPPVNGTPSLMSGISNGVEKIS